MVSKAANIRDSICSIRLFTHCPIKVSFAPNEDF
jgi:hypothetical protein